MDIEPDSGPGEDRDYIEGCRALDRALDLLGAENLLRELSNHLERRRPRHTSPASECPVCNPPPPEEF